MNAVLAEILRTQQVTDGVTLFPLHSHMSEVEGRIIAQAIQMTAPHTSLEIGFAYGISTLFACEAIVKNEISTQHIVIDPTVRWDCWHGIGLKNVARAGYGHVVRFIEEYSEIALPRLLSDGTRIQFAIIDGMHTFDHALVDFFYVNKLLDVGGIVVLDDTNMPSLKKLSAHIATYPAYKYLFDNKPAGNAFSLRGSVRRSIAAIPGFSAFERPWDNPQPSCIAFQKVATDERNWDWHRPF